MKLDINDSTQEEVNDFAIVCSNYFNGLGFKQIYLNSSIDYFISNTKYITLPNNKYLRCNTEPDIWEKSRGSKTFFAVTSLFRLEDLSSLLHKQEFKILDFYLYDSSYDKIVGEIMHVLESYEQKFDAPELSKLKQTRIGYEDFNTGQYDKSIPQIFVVSGYPLSETFYDDLNNEGIPLKVELFFVFNEVNIEFAVLGKVGVNLNPINFIHDYNFSSPNPNLWGGGVGIERVLLIYKFLTQ